VTTCEICGTEFDELGVQIVIPGLAKSFDRLDCAARARTLAGPPAFNVKPLQAVFVDVGPGGTARSYGLPGLQAGLAAVLAGRTRLAVGGATVAVALLAAATVHLSARFGGGSDPAAKASVLPSPSSPAANLAFRGHTAVARGAKSSQAVIAVRTPQETDGVYLIAARAAKSSQPVIAVRTPQETDGVYLIAARDAPDKARPQRRKQRAAKHARSTSATTLARAAESVSTRRGWGWGDKNHAHAGPANGSGAKHTGKARGRGHK
jgi:hypothetical protein